MKRTEEWEGEFFLSPDDGLLKPKHYNVDFLSY